MDEIIAITMTGLVAFFFGVIFEKQKQAERHEDWCSVLGNKDKCPICKHKWVP